MPIKAEHDAGARHHHRFGNRALRQKAEHGQSQHHQAEIFGWSKRHRHPRQAGRDQHQQDDANRTGEERRQVAAIPSAGPARPRLAISCPSRHVTTLAASPGILTRIDVVDPPYIEP